MKRKNEIWEITWRVIAISLIIDIPIWLYIHYVKKETIIEAVQKLNKKHITKNNYNAEIIKKKFNNSLITKEEYEKWPEYRELIKNMKNNEKIYCWEDKNGKIHYSNIGFPSKPYKPKWIRHYSNK